MIDVRLSREDELPVLTDFSAKEWPSADKEHFGDQTVDFSKKKSTFVARDDGRVVGYISIVLDMGVLHMESVIVAETYRGKGVGALLVSAAEEYGKSSGAHKIWLETGSDWRAKEFYEKLGYRVRAALPGYWAKRDFVLMDKDIV
jgi:ribosomal protein S18 acetylase RimI-like enzyme